jgi:hypothetical protein
LLLRERIDDQGSADIQAQMVAAFAAGRVTDVGIVPEIDVFRSDPYLVARALASLDILSGGRAGYAPFAEARGSLDIGFASTGTDAIFVEEFVVAVGKLWNNWQPGALARDWDANRYVDSRLIRRADHEGRYFSIKGPLPTSTAFQPEPVVIARSHPSHDLILDRAAAIIAPTDIAFGPQAKTLTEVSLHNLQPTNQQGVLLNIDESVTTWADFVTISNEVADRIGWKPHTHPQTLTETLGQISDFLETSPKLGASHV